MIVPLTEKVALVVKNPFTGDVGDAIQFLGQEDLWKRKCQTSILAWRISMDKGTWWPIICGVTKSLDTT